MRKYIPNCITCLNLFSGCIAVVFAFHHLYSYSLCLVILAAVFDFFDGFAARALKSYSPLGKELDSLADMVSFGFAPGMMAYSLLTDACRLMPEPLAFGLPFVAFLIPVASALRLAKFNIDERQTSSFIGLATPANALFWGGLLSGYAGRILSLGAWGAAGMIVLVVVMSLLLVAELPMFSLKFHSFGWRENRVRYLFLIVSAVLLLFGVAAFAWIIMWYIVWSIIGPRILKD